MNTLNFEEFECVAKIAAPILNGGGTAYFYKTESSEPGMEQIRVVEEADDGVYLLGKFNSPIGVSFQNVKMNEKYYF